MLRKNCFLLIGLIIGLLGCDAGSGRTELQPHGDELNPPPSAYTQAAPCSAADLACHTLVDLYVRKPGFKEALDAVMVLDAIGRPLWLENALSSRFSHYDDDRGAWIFARACEPRNCAQILQVAYNETDQRLYGFYRSNDDIRWFGSPSEADMDRLCTEDRACTLALKVSEISPVLVKLGYPVIRRMSDFATCTEYRGGLQAKNGYVCMEQLLQSCPYSKQSCTISGEFVNEQLAAVSYKYKNGQVNGEELRKTLNKAFGKVDPVISQPDASGKLTSWTSEWQESRVVIKLRRVKGVNNLGERYDDLWLVFVDKAFDLFNR